MTHPAPRRTVSTGIVAYVCTVALFAGASFLPDQRLWGIAVWAYSPLWSRIVLLTCGLVGLYAAMRVVGRTDRAAESSRSDSQYWLISASILVALGVCFILLRNRTHFLGDGYTLLANLADQNPVAKGRNLGEHMVHVWLKDLLGGDPKAAALSSFRMISIGSGLLFVAASAITARFLYTSNLKRVLFTLGLAGGGWALLFFGYAENYSLFTLSIALFLLAGVLHTRGRISRWWILLPLALALFFHSLGATLLPAAAYLLMKDTSLGLAIGQISRQTRTGVIVICGVIGVAIFIQLYTTDYFFRFAFVPFIANRFTIDGYTLLSARHLIDYLNLLMLLFPGLLVLLSLLPEVSLGKILHHAEIRFVLITVAVTMGTMFVLDPKLGMPRDWDLFSLPGIPIVLFALLVLLASSRRNLIGATVLIVFLGFLSLGPRVIGQVQADMAIAQFTDYISIDKQRSRTAWYLLSNYYYERADTTRTIQIEKQREILYPEERMVIAASMLCRQGKCAEAKPTLDHVLVVNPQYADAWASLCTYFIGANRFDSALTCIKIADGLNPYNPGYLNEMGRAYSFLNDFDGARKAWGRSSQIDTVSYAPVFNIARMYQVLGDKKLFLQYLTEASLRRDAPYNISREVGQVCLENGDIPAAAEALSRALRRGMDTAEVRQFAEKYPSLNVIF
ncbi:MAG: tetratricopeptide repeat protein [Candidatus Zixiibacteriota bacterium]